MIDPTLRSQRSARSVSDTEATQTLQQAMNDPFGLNRFVEAQGPVYAQVLRELAAGSKASHWMWYVFPQLRGLGWTWTANHYGIASLAEARAYLAHPVLGPRLEECVALVLGLTGRSAEQIFGYPDYLKFRSCLTLFGTAAPDVPVFPEALARYCGGEADPLTLERLALAQAEADQAPR